MSVVSIWPPVMWLMSAPCAVVAGGSANAFAAPLGGRHPPGHQADGGAFDIAFDAGDLSGKAQARHGLKPQPLVEELGAVEEGVAVQAAKPGEFRRLEARNGPEDAQSARHV